MSLPDHSIKIAIDRGGTFTDVYAEWPSIDPSDGKRQEILKLLSSDPAHYPDAPREGVRRVLELATGEAFARNALLPTNKIASIRLSTTVATNSLLERQGARHALLVTKGFRDLLEIGNQSRPKIFDLNIRRPGVLYEKVVEVDERVTLVGYTSDPRNEERKVVFSEDGRVQKGYDGESTDEGGDVVRGLSGEAVRIMKKLDDEAVKAQLKELYDEGYRSLAVVLMHSFTYPEHEERIRTLAQDLNFDYVSISSASMPVIRISARGSSTTADAYLTPVLHKYVDGFFDGFEKALRDEVGAQEEGAGRKGKTTVEFMRSDGGLTDVKGFTGLKSILSGPAGGVVGYALTSWEKGGQGVIGLDMGGTSTDVSLYSGEFETVFETTTAGITIQSPQLNVNTVAAGGGSRLFFRNGLFVTGPESAGSDPGPSCYLKDGPPAITDANLVLGRLLPDYFPKIFGESEKEPLGRDASVSALEKLRSEINEQTGSSMALDEVAWGFIKVANETMCRPVRALTEARGYDTTKHILACFGGAGGQHACDIAATLGIKTVLIHRYSSVLSAYGMALAERVHEKQEPASDTWGSDEVETRLKTKIEQLSQMVRDELRKQGFEDERIEVHPYLNMRYNGTDSALMIHQPEEGFDFKSAFAKTYKQEFGFAMNVPIIVDDVRVRGVGKSFDSLGPSVFSEAKELSFTPLEGGRKEAEKTSVYFEQGGRQDVSVYLLGELEAGDLVQGPAMIIDGTQTILVDPRGRAKITSKHILIELKLK